MLDLLFFAGNVMILTNGRAQAEETQRHWKETGSAGGFSWNAIPNTGGGYAETSPRPVCSLDKPHKPFQINSFFREGTISVGRKKATDPRTVWYVSCCPFFPLTVSGAIPAFLARCSEERLSNLPVTGQLLPSHPSSALRNGEFRVPLSWLWSASLSSP